MNRDVTLWKRIESWLASPRTAIVLIGCVTGVSALATLVPQTDLDPAAVGRWAGAHPAPETVVRVFGFHAAYSSPIFLGLTALLALSTCVCAMRRTRAALGRLALWSISDEATAAELLGRPRLECSAGGPGIESIIPALRRQRLFVRESSTEGFVFASSGRFAVLGSTVFHWSLVGLFLVLIAGQLTRSSGLMGVPIGNALPNVPASYRVLNTGPLYRWSGTPVSIGVTGLLMHNVVGGLDRGPSPHVVIKAQGGAVLAQGDVYPNSALRFGALVVHPSAWGLVADVALLDRSGSVLATNPVLVDLPTSSAATQASGSLNVSGDGGQALYRVAVTVPLVGAQSTSGATAASRRTRFVVADSSGATVAQAELVPGQQIALPDGTALRLDAQSAYARLSVVDDWSIAAVYSLFVIATLAVAGSLLAPQVIVIASGPAQGTAGSAGCRVWVRAWRAGPGRVSAIEASIRDALCADSEDGVK